MKLIFSAIYFSAALVAITSAFRVPIATPPTSPAVDQPLKPVVHQLPRNCKKIDVRRNIADLTVAQRDAFFNAVQKLKDMPDPVLGDTSIFDKYVKIHLDYQVEGHGNAQFGPWHRLFIREFEMELQRVDPSVVLPFWSPERSIVFTKDYFGGNGDPTTGCLTTGRFADWQIQYPQKGCLQRQYNGGTVIGALTAPELLEKLIYASNNFTQFAGGLEFGVHARVHNGVGGTMAKMESNSDPLFYLHHANVDRLWSMYQSRGLKQSNEYQGKLPGKRGLANLDDVLMPFNKTVRQAMNIVDDLCYVYTKRRIPKPPKSTNAPQASPTSPVLMHATTKSLPSTTPAVMHATVNSMPSNTTSGAMNMSSTMPESQESNLSSQATPMVMNSTLVEPQVSSLQSNTTSTHMNSTMTETQESKVQSVYSGTNSQQAPAHSSPYVIDPFDRTNMKFVRYPITVPVAWLKMNHISVEDYAASEAILHKDIEKYNASPYDSVSSLQFYSEIDTCDVISDKVYAAYGVPVPSKKTVQLTAPIGNINYLRADAVTDALQVDPQELTEIDEDGRTSHAPSSAPSKLALAGSVIAASVLFFM